MLFDVVSSDAAYEKFTSAIGLGELLEKPEGEDLQADAPLESYTVICSNKTFGRVTRFSKESVEDAKSDPWGACWGARLSVKYYCCVL